MPLEIRCPSCQALMRVPEIARGRLVRCPKCKNAVRVSPAEPAIGKEPAISRPPAQASPFVFDDDSPVELVPAARKADVAPAPRESPREEMVEEVVEEVVKEPIPEVEEVEDLPAKRPPKRKKRKRKRAHLPAEEGEQETPAWVWWAFGGGGMVAAFLTLLLIAFLTPSDNRLKLDAVYLLVAQPISMAFFFLAMILANFIAEAVDFGELHIMVIKIFFLVLAVNVVSLVPFGRWMTAPIWPIAMMIIFRLDLFEAFMVSFFNWLLNYGLNLALMAGLAAWIMHGGAGAGRIDSDRPSNTQSETEPEEIWTEDEIRQLGGKTQPGPIVDGEITVAVISFADLPIGDAVLAHMKDFPRLIKLDLTGTQVTDAGMKHLAACNRLQTLVLTRTRVTDAAVQELQKTLPRLKVQR